MRLRLWGSAASVAEVDGSPTTEIERLPSEAVISELRPVENFRVCRECLVVNSAGDAFCTACGAQMPVTEEKADRPERALPRPLPPIVSAPVSVDADDVETGPRRRILGRVAFGLTVALICALPFAVLWRIEVSHARDLSADLQSTRRTLAETQAKLKETEASLQSVEQLSEKRKAVLLRARAVLAGVDPILSSVDELQNNTADIQSARDTFTSHTDTLMTDLITLANYAIETDPAYVDEYYLNQLIDTANGDLDTVRTDEVSLGGYDSSYNAASDRFGNRADDFTRFVRQLQRQLEQVTAVGHGD